MRVKEGMRNEIGKKTEMKKNTTVDFSIYIFV